MVIKILICQDKLFGLILLKKSIIDYKHPWLLFNVLVHI